jgi:signal transduction histidine kinase
VGGFAAWLGQGAQHLLEFWLDPSLRAEPARQACTVAFFLFGIAYAAACLFPLGNRWKITLLVVQTATGLWLSWYSYGAFSAVFVVTTAEAAFLFSRKVTYAWLLAQVVGTTVIFLLRPDMPLVTALAAATMYATFELFSLFAANSILDEVFARSELARLNAQLIQARETLAEHARTQERLHISRELHDSVGHHLTALALKLEVACHSDPKASAVHVREARTMVGEVLAEMRAVVTELRNQEHPPLAHRLRELAGHISSPKVHLTLPEELEVAELPVAHVLYRCTQEIITNTARHAHAQNLWIRLHQEGEHLCLEARDDGQGASELHPNSGLRVMRERVEEVGGELQLHSRPGSGVSVQVRVPMRSR